MNPKIYVDQNGILLYLQNVPEVPRDSRSEFYTTKDWDKYDSLLSEAIKGGVEISSQEEIAELIADSCNACAHHVDYCPQCQNTGRYFKDKLYNIPSGYRVEVKYSYRGDDEYFTNDETEEQRWVEVATKKGFDGLKKSMPHWLFKQLAILIPLDDVKNEKKDIEASDEWKIESMLKQDEDDGYRFNNKPCGNGCNCIEINEQVHGSESLKRGYQCLKPIDDLNKLKSSLPTEPTEEKYMAEELRKLGTIVIGEKEGWISVKERLPENGDCVAVSHVNSPYDPVIARYRNDHAKPFIISAGQDWGFDSVTHWLKILPLPKAPK